MHVKKIKLNVENLDVPKGRGPVLSEMAVNLDGIRAVKEGEPLEDRVNNRRIDYRLRQIAGPRREDGIRTIAITDEDFEVFKDLSMVTNEFVKNECEKHFEQGFDMGHEKGWRKGFDRGRETVKRMSLFDRIFKRF